MKLRLCLLLMLWYSGEAPDSYAGKKMIGVSNFNNVCAENQNEKSYKESLIIISLKVPVLKSTPPALPVFITESDKNSHANVTDTIIFDFTRAVIQGSYIEFPIYFSSTDTIHALDFAFRYNEIKTQFTSLTSLDPGLQYLYYYNFADSTFRFTSNSLLPLIPNSDLLQLRFQMQYGQLCPGDLYDIEAYLNGNSCNYSFTDCILTFTEPLSDHIPEIRAYPNPVNSYLNIEAPLNSTINLTSMQGEQQIAYIHKTQDPFLSMNIQNLPPGIYILTIISNRQMFKEKIVVY